MEVAPEITFNHMERESDLESLVGRRIAKLERCCDRITSCDTVVEKARVQASSGDEYRVQVIVKVPPQHELVGEYKQGDEHRFVGPDEAIDRAFDAVERQVRSLSDPQGDRPN